MLGYPLVPYRVTEKEIYTQSQASLNHEISWIPELRQISKKDKITDNRVQILLLTQDLNNLKLISAFNYYVSFLPIPNAHTSYLKVSCQVFLPITTLTSCLKPRSPNNNLFLLLYYSSCK